MTRGLGRGVRWLLLTPSGDVEVIFFSRWSRWCSEIVMLQPCELLAGFELGKLRPKFSA